jgi:hypothetical protein
LRPAEKQPVAHQSQPSGDDKGGDLFQALDHEAFSYRLHFQFA